MEMIPGAHLNIPEKGENPAPKLLKLIERTGLADRLVTEDSFREFFNGLSFEQFTDYLTRANGVIREVPITARAIDGTSTASVGVDYPPRKEDKIALLHSVFESAQRMSEAGRSQEDIAILVAGVENAIHPFADANGRTSRLLYFLLSHTHENIEGEKEDLQGLMQETRGRGKVDFNSYYLNSGIYKNLARKYGFNNQDKDTPRYFSSTAGDERKAAVVALADNLTIDDQDLVVIQRMCITRESMMGQAGFLAVANFLKSKGAIDEFSKKQHRGRSEEEDDYYTTIEIDKVIKGLDQDSAKELVEEYWKAKKDYVETMIASIEHPEQYTSYPDDPNDKTTLLGTFKFTSLKEYRDRKHGNTEQIKQDDDDDIFVDGGTAGI